ncbi:MAG: saccharopine dehydrogenase NADP-binding domain-containing protein [Phycisphaerales bacterium]|nr:saccharopine dehydrogenase NADP-binding domain-containing protein [Phycisphaerales bacterium]
MAYEYVVLGAGRQGVALAYDLAKNGEAAGVRLFDVDAAVAERAVARLRQLIPGTTCRFSAARCDVADAAAASGAMRGAHCVLSAVPYVFNERLTNAAIDAGASFLDLGGNTSVVRSQLAMHEIARARGVSIVPDCGLAPGLGNSLAAQGIASMDAPRHVHVRCGGLPQQRVGPLQYKLVFNFDGLMNEYSGFGEFLRDGKHVEVPALSEPESINFPGTLGTCEAAVTSGGTSTCPHTYHGRLETYDYKTVRYPGHFDIIRVLFALGCFESNVPLSRGGAIQPRPIMRALFEERLTFPEVRDLVVLRTVVRGTHQGKSWRTQYDLYDLHDEKTGFTAMERTTAFPAALVAHFQARKLVEPGARPLEVAVPAREYFEELAKHDIHIRVTETTDD